MEDNTPKYIVKLSDGNSFQLTEQEYKDREDAIYGKDKDATAMRISNNVLDNDDIDDNATYSVSIGDNKFALSADEYKARRDKLRGMNGVVVDSVSNANHWGNKLGEIYDEMASLQEELKGQVIPGRDENGNYTETRISLGSGTDEVQGDPRAIQGSSLNEMQNIMRERREDPERKKKEAAERRLEELRAERDNNPAWQKFWEQTNSSIDEDLSRVEEMQAEAKKRVKDGDTQSLMDPEILEATKNMLLEAKKVASAPSKYDNEGGALGQYLADYGKGIVDTGFDALSFVNTAKKLKNVNLIEALQQIQRNEGDDANVSDLIRNHKDEISYLSNEQKELVQAFVKNAEIQQSRSDNISNAYKAGQGFAQSLGFMADFLMAGQIFGEKGLATAGPLVEKTAKGSLGRLGAETVEGAVKALVMTPLMPSTYSNVLDSILQLDENGGVDLSGKAVLKAIGDAAIENISETVGSKPLELLGWGIGKLPVGEAIGKTKFGQVAKAMRHSPIFNSMKQAGWNGLVEEMFEEVTGNYLRYVTGIDKKALGEFFKPDEFFTTLASFAPMSLLGGLPSTASFIRSSNKMTASQDVVKNMLSEAGVSEDQIMSIISSMQDAESPEAVGEILSTAYDLAVKNGVEPAKAIAAIQGYAKNASEYKVLEGVYEEQKDVERTRTALDLDVKLGTPNWRHEGQNGEQFVRTFTDENGNVFYMQNEDEGGVYSAIGEDGKLKFIYTPELQDGKYMDSGEIPMNSFLDGEVRDQKAAREQVRMQQETESAQNQLAREAYIGRDDIEVGTPEASVKGVITQFVGGKYVVQGEDGSIHTYSPQEMANKLNVNLTPKTDEQITTEEVAAMEKADQSRVAVNAVAGRISLDGFRVGIPDGSVAERVIKKDDGSLMLIYRDQRGNRKITDLSEGELDALAEMAKELPEVEENIETPAERKAEEIDLQQYIGEDGEMDEDALWTDHPEEWARWNDSQRNDGGANSVQYIRGAIGRLEAEIAAAQTAYANEPNFKNRKAIEQDLEEKRNRLNTLTGVLNAYETREAAAQAEAEAKTQEEIEKAKAEEAAQAEEERQKPLEERAREWEKRTGQKVTIFHSYDEIPKSEVTARATIRMNKKMRFPGWFSNGRVMIYLPHVNSEKDVDQTYMHEVIAHMGLKDMLKTVHEDGKVTYERFNELLDRTWNDIMSEEDQEKFTRYVKISWPDAEGDDLRRAAADEYIAWLAENIDTNPSAWEKFAALVKEILEKILGTELKITDADLKTLLQASLARYEARAKAGNAEAAARLAEEGIASNAEETRFSVKYAPKTEEEANQIAKDISEQVGVSEEDAKKWVESETSLAAVIEQKENQPYLEYTADDRYNAIKENSDYPQGTVDFNNICRKRIAFTEMYQRIQKAFPNVIITGEDLANIRNIMKSHGLMVACGLCYVEDRRQLLGEIAKDFIDNYANNFEDYASRGGEAKKKNAEKFRKLLGEDRKDDLSIYDLITLAGSTKLYEEHPGIYEAFQAFNNARGQQTGNLFQGYAEYKREILKWTKSHVDKVNRNGGLRVFSYSDFEAHHLIDLVQIIQDCARKGVKIQGYTKVPAFARAVANTNIKLNRSLIPLGDTGIVDGKLAYDSVEGIDINDENFLESNDNIGNILIGINDEQIRLAMADPFVHYIIPYHSNQKEILRTLKQTGKWTNYKPYQNEKDSTGKTTLLNIYTDVIAAAEAEGNPIQNERQFTEKFLEVCEQKGLTPRFEQFLDRKGGKYVYTPGYYKLLLDFKMFDENGRYLPQNPVVAQFDDRFNAQILNDYVKGEQEKFEGNLDAVYDEIISSLGLEDRVNTAKKGQKALDGIVEKIGKKKKEYDEKAPMRFRIGDPSTEVGNTFFRINDGTLVGLHNISEDKLRKADKAGGLANPSAAVIDITKQEHNNFGEISLVMPSSMVAATSGKNNGTYLGDAWTPTFPGTQKKMSKVGQKAFDKQIMALPSDVRYVVENSFNNYLEEDRDGNALRWWFLQDTGRNPAIVHYESPYSEEDAKTIGRIDEWDPSDDEIRAIADLFKKYAPEEDVRKATTRFDTDNFNGSSQFVRRRMEEYNDEIDKYGIHLGSAKSFIGQAKDQLRRDGRLDDYTTMDTARQFIEDNNLGEEFRNWLEGKEDEFGVETKLFAGWDRNGYKKWIDYTAENASKLMNKESGRNAYSDNGLSATHALLVKKMRTLADIKKNKDLLVSRAEYDERYDQVDKELHNAISTLDNMQKISDNPFTNYDYTASRLQEALTRENPAAYLNSEYKYSIPEDGEYAQQLQSLKRDIMEMPVNYFETKFNRPVGLNEFTSAVVPSNLDEKTRKILEDAGVKMFEYDPKQEGSRRDATMKATEPEGIRFRVANENQRIFISNAEKAVEEMKMDKATPEQWKKTIEKNGGLKAAEDKWLGLSTWLDGLDRKTVTKREILDFIAENQIKIEETHYKEGTRLHPFKQIYDSAEYEALNKRFKELVEEDVNALGVSVAESCEVNFENLADEIEESQGKRRADLFYDGFDYDSETADLSVKTDRNGAPHSEALEFFGIKEDEANYINTTRLHYTTEGLRNKSEIALTVPTIEPWNENDQIHFGDAGEGRAISWARFGDTWTSKAKDEAEKKYREADKAFRDYRNEIVSKYALQATDTKKTKDLATEEENNKVKELQMEANRLYHEWQYGQHPREKVLVIDEIQSKRHQEGREKGYANGEEKPLLVGVTIGDYTDAGSYRDGESLSLAPIQNERGEVVGQMKRRKAQQGQTYYWAEINDASITSPGWFSSEKDALGILKERVDEQLNSIPLPAPFEKDWPALTMKRMLRYAAENGYEYMAWTTGEQQAERYSLGQVLNHIEAGKWTTDEEVGDGRNYGEESKSLTLYTNDNEFSIDVNRNGKILASDMNEFDGKQLSEVLGKELAVKILSDENGGEYSGDQLHIGGEGMKGFYDDILPRWMNKYGKKWGVKVEDINLPLLGEDAAAGIAKGLTMHSVRVTPEMKESVMQGQTMFRVTPEQDKEYLDAVESGDMEKAQEMVRDAAAIAMPNTKIVDEDGKPRVVYHGGSFGQEAIADYDPYVWEPEFGNGWFATNKQLSKRFVHDFDQEPIQVFLNIRNPFAMGDTMQLLIDNKKATALAEDYAERLGVGVEDILGLIDTDYSLEDAKGVTYRSEAFAINRNPKFAELLKSRGYDGAMDIEADGTVAYMTTDPSQIKSADPVTYDDNGNVIPLSERFNPGNEDIRFRVIDAYSQIRRGNIDSIAEQISSGNGTVKVRTAGLKEKEIKALNRKVAEYSNGTLDDVKKRSDEIQASEAVQIKKEVVSYDDMSKSLRGNTFPVADGAMVGFSEKSIDKLNVDTIKNSGVGKAIVSLLRNSRFAYAQPDFEDATGTHTKRKNVIEYRNYVSLFDNGDGPQYCRFTVQNFNDARLVSHGAMVSDVEITKKDLQNSLTAPSEPRPLGATESLFDTKLLNFFYFANTGEQLFEGAEYEIPVLETPDSTDAIDGEGGSLFRIAPEEEESAIRFRTVTDPLKVAELEAKPKVKVYRSMQEIDGKLYPPMSARVEGELRQPTELGVWEESEERPELADEKGEFQLNKGNGKSIPAAYAPYFHTRRSPLNEQFSEAYNRPNLVIVEGEIPESELTSGYTAEKSKKSVGEHDWPSGKVSNALAKQGADTRKVLLSRWFKPVRIVPNSEVADIIMDKIGDSEIAFPYNVVTPSLRQELAKRGAEFDGWQGNKPKNWEELIDSMRKENEEAEGNEIRFSIRGLSGAQNANDQKALDNLTVATLMDDAGNDMPTIWRATGWEKGADGKWRNEIPDAKQKEGTDLKPTNRAGDILDAPELFESYPQLEDIEIELKNLPGSTVGVYMPKENKIVADINNNTELEDGKQRFNSEGMRTILHELQHAIQYIEGFAKGGSEKSLELDHYKEVLKKDPALAMLAFTVFKSGRNSAAKVLRAGRSVVLNQAEILDISMWADSDKKAFATLIEKLKGMDESEFKSFAKKAAKMAKEAKKYGDSGYKKLAGEVEARNVERRSHLNDVLRGKITLRGSEDVTRDEQIVRFRIGDTSYDESPEGMQEAAQKTADSCGIEIEYKPSSEMMRDGKPLAGKWEDGRMYICLEHCRDTNDAVKTVLHEGIGHNGLRKLIGNESMPKFLMDVYKALPASVRQEIASKAISNYGGNINEATEEYLAGRAENINFEGEPEERSFWDSVRGVLRKWLAKVGINVSLNDHDVRWIMWQSYNANKQDDMLNQVQRSLLARKLGFSSRQQADKGEAIRISRNREATNAEVTSSARSYNFAARNVWRRLKESFVDQFTAINDLIDAIEKETGKKAQDFEDVRLALNQQGSKALAKMNDWITRFNIPMWDAIKKVMKEADCKLADVERYVMLKHGLERNEVFAKRDAREYYKHLYDKAVEKINDDESMTIEDKEYAIQKEKERYERHLEKIEKGTDPKYKDLREQDYGGLTGLYSEFDPIEPQGKHETNEEFAARQKAARHPKYDSVEEMEEAARKEVEEFEKRADTDNLWDKINAATRETLKQQYESNNISRDQYNHVKGMFKYYVPLRGFSDIEAEDLFDYYNSDQRQAFTAPLQRAKGRTTQAESPFGFIAAAQSSGVAQNMKNESKLALYYFISNRPNNGLVNVSETWYEKVGEDEDGKAIFEPVYPKFDENLSSDAAKKAFEDWERGMKEKAKAGLAFKGKKNLDLSKMVVHINPKHETEHTIPFKLGGKDMFMYINGNPRAAQAVNGDLNYNAEQGVLTETLNQVLRSMSALNTQLNPEFWISNFQRDALFAIMSTSVKEDGKYAKAFRNNLLKAGKVVKMKKAYENGELGDSEDEKLYREFVENGGVTGYTVVYDNEYWEKRLDEYAGKDKNAVAKVLDALKGFSEFGEAIEQMTRFAAYKTSRESGKDIIDSVNDAKELTVNFNRKGSGKAISLEEAKNLKWPSGRPLNKAEQYFVSIISNLSPWGRRMIMFFNASIQGLNAMVKLFQKNPKKTAAWVGGYLMMGALNAALHAMGDDDDDYLDIPDYERRNNLMLGANGAFLKWALPQEARVFYGIGDMIVNHALGREPHKSMVGEILSSLGEVAPVDFVSGINGPSELTGKAIADPLVPSAARPLWEIWLNKNFMGSRVYNEHKYYSEEERKNIPAYRDPLPNTSGVYIGLSKALNYLSGGDDYSAGFVNVNPNKLEHLVEGYTGGAGTSIEKLAQFFENTAKGDFQVRDTPFLRKVLSLNDERYRNSHTTDLYYYYQDRAAETAREIKEATKNGDDAKLDKLYGKKKYEEMLIFDRYKSLLKYYNDELKVTDDEDDRRALMREQDALRKEMIKEISEIGK